MPTLLQPNGRPAVTLSDQQSSRNRQAVLPALGKLGLIMFGLGAGARGLKGLGGLGQRNLAGSSSSAIPAGRPISVRRSPDEEKYAGDESPWYRKLLAPVTKPFSDAAKGNVSTPAAVPWAMPAAAATGGLALYGGWRGADKLMSSRRESEQAARLEKAKREYEEAISGGSKLAQDLSQLYKVAMAEKTAVTAADFAGYGMGTALTTGLLLGAGSGLLTYDMTKKRQPGAILREAKRRRDRQRGVPTIYAKVDEDEERAKMSADQPKVTPFPSQPKPPAAPTPVPAIAPRR